jgi:hypothetical protein
MKTFKVILTIFLAAGIIIAFYFYFFSEQPIPFFEKEKKEYSNEELTQMAQKLFEQKKAEGLDMSDGPCLTNELIPGWVVDVAHDPRQPIDNQPENQCSAFRQGKAEHFIELDTNGNLNRTK